MNKNTKKKIIFIIAILLIIEIPFILYLFNSNLVAFNEKFYKKEFLKYNIYQKFPDKDIDAINSNLLDYLRYDKTDEYIKIDLFNQEEKEHLLDVKNLIQKSMIFLNTLIILVIILIAALFLIDKKKFIRKLSLAFIWGGIITLIDALCFALLIKINFNFIFTLFHKLFFKQGTWLFEAGSNIIKLYPSEFFSDIALHIATKTLILAFIFTIMGLFIFYNKKILNIPKKD